ncbi:hypothetical protein EDB84DRAFT_1440244 [Lactarius hengduanensis]|nr:hypothetical protein EDB84DRAFT_1632725 [Lactarius hengduanensis]KAH9019387.1 hypothetical protein EDB84DRAFT_1442147 [Lactarius hengduanensis]KAH9026025.1 hypothetical protein EDB84DRAFT_1440244 [Lactarius hengduanensis]
MTKENEEEWAVDANVFISQEDDDTQVYSIRLKTFYDGNPSIVIVDQRPLINFGRCTLLLKRIGEVQRYRAPAAVDLLEKHHPPQHHWRRSSNSSGDSTAAGTGAGAAALACGEGGARERAEQHIEREVRGAREGACREGAPHVRDARARASRAWLWAAHSVHGHEGLIVLAYKKATSLRKVNPVAGSIPKDFCIGWDKVTTTATRTKMTTTTATN